MGTAAGSAPMMEEVNKISLRLFYGYAKMRSQCLSLFIVSCMVCSIYFCFGEVSPNPIKSKAILFFFNFLHINLSS